MGERASVVRRCRHAAVRAKGAAPGAGDACRVRESRACARRLHLSATPPSDTSPTPHHHLTGPPPHLSTSCSSAASMRATACRASASNKVAPAPPLPLPSAAAGSSGFSPARLYTRATSANSPGPYCCRLGRMTAGRQSASLEGGRDARQQMPKGAALQRHRAQRPPCRLTPLLAAPHTWHKGEVECFVHKAQPRHGPQHAGQAASIAPKLQPGRQARVGNRVHAALACAAAWARQQRCSAAPLPSLTGPGAQELRCRVARRDWPAALRLRPPPRSCHPPGKTPRAAREWAVIDSWRALNPASTPGCCSRSDSAASSGAG
jgi:hypothetical protein